MVVRVTIGPSRCPITGGWLTPGHTLEISEDTWLDYAGFCDPVEPADADQEPDEGDDPESDRPASTVEPITNAENPGLPVGAFACPYCATQFKSRAGFNIHMHHAGKSPCHQKR